MADPLRTIELLDLVDRLRAGDREAEDILYRRSSARLEALARKMLRTFPDVKRWEQTDDVLVNAAMRLGETLRAVRPASVAGYFTLAARSVRRSLLDLAKHHRGPTSVAANYESRDGLPPDAAAAVDPLEDWTAFHEAVGALPDEEREVIDLAFYESLTPGEIARVLDVSVKTVSRRRQSALLLLEAAVAGNIPV